MPWHIRVAIHTILSTVIIVCIEIHTVMANLKHLPPGLVGARHQ